jgi:diacylglycerol kinase (ATP)
MRIHFIAAILVLVVSLGIRLSKYDVILLFFAIALVLAAEMFNTAIETTIDLVTSKYHRLAYIAKNVAAGAVLVTAVNAAVVGYIIFFPRLHQFIPFVAESLRNYPPYLSLAAVVLVVTAVIIGKISTGKGRPFTGGMPSGHAAISFSLTTVILLITHEPLVSFLAFCISLLVAQSRLEAKIHSLWEVVAGALLGIFLTVLVFQIFGH